MELSTASLMQEKVNLCRDNTDMTVMMDMPMPMDHTVFYGPEYFGPSFAGKRLAKPKIENSRNFRLGSVWKLESLALVEDGNQWRR